MSHIKVLSSAAEFKEYINVPSLTLVHFSVTWNEQCIEVEKFLLSLQIEQLINFPLAKIDAEEFNQISDAFKVTSAPTIVFFRNGKDVDRVIGVEEMEIRNAVAKQIFYFEEAADTDSINAHSTTCQKKESLNDRLKKLINKSRVTLFIKGNAQQPKCGFSRQIVGMLNDLNVDFWTFDILNDEEVRQGLKTYSDWPTYPQLYLDGEFMGGLDVIREEIKDPEFVKKLPKKI